MNNNINVALITDKNYFFPALVTIKSTLENSQSNTHVKCILTEKVDYDLENIKKQLEKEYSNSKVEFLHFDDSDLSYIKTKFHISRAAYVKIYLPEILSEWDKCIFLDSDLLVRKDITVLWKKSFEDSEPAELSAVWNPGYNHDNEFIGVTESDKTLNSGVLVMDLEKMRTNKSTKKLENFIREFNAKTHLNDQPAFNAVYKGQWKELPLEWNSQFLFFARRASKNQIDKKEQSVIVANPAIVHFTTSSKPWKYRSVHPYKKEYMKYYSSFENSIYEGKITFVDTLKRVRESLLMLLSKV